MKIMAGGVGSSLHESRQIISSLSQGAPVIVGFWWELDLKNMWMVY